jgi:hypothetical protein
MTVTCFMTIDRVVHFSIVGGHQTLLSCVPTATLVLTTEKILLNVLRLTSFIRRQFAQQSTWPMSNEGDFLRQLSASILELRSPLMIRLVQLDRSTTATRSYPICLFESYLLNAIECLVSIHKIDGIYGTRRRTVKEID